ncbi:uncharacterized protein At5g65660-like [Amaranthus tricolor]|uniref:uncharacterized protein At5g65660-like n=1 Tax=Amaranthus tricolor TaxID=29722 RepID=UPI0025901EF2|nr:uncharacterized protein At5g65660-like [Amaranthus tricolor]
MGEGENWGLQPIGSPNVDIEKSDVHWSHFDSSVNAVSFGFVATAVLISMFLVMAIFERFLRPNSLEISASVHQDIESQMGFYPKLGYSSPKMTVYSQELPVLMPGDNIPTFIAHPVPLPCPPDRIQWPPLKFKTPQITGSTQQSIVRDPT